MNTQTFAQAQDFKAINDDALIAVNGGGAGKTPDFDISKLHIPIIIGGYTGPKIIKAVADT